MTRPTHILEALLWHLTKHDAPRITVTLTSEQARYLAAHLRFTQAWPSPDLERAPRAETVTVEVEA